MPNNGIVFMGDLFGNMLWLIISSKATIFTHLKYWTRICLHTLPHMKYLCLVKNIRKRINISYLMWIIKFSSSNWPLLLSQVLNLYHQIHTPMRLFLIRGLILHKYKIDFCIPENERKMEILIWTPLPGDF